MPEHPFIIRPLHTRDEIAAFIRVAHEAFSSSGNPEETVADNERYLATSPTVEDEVIWGAFDPEDQRLLGGYWIEYRQFQIDSVSLKTGCIGAVSVANAERKRGVAAAMMEDAVNNAVNSDIPLLLLTGIPDFYHRFGYVPVVEENKVTFKRDLIQALPPEEGILLQPATAADAETLDALYEEHLHLPVGHFERSLAEQTFRIEGTDTESVYLLARNVEGKASGYLLFSQSKSSLRQKEVVATDWPTLSALLQAYERRLTAHEEALAKQETEESETVNASGIATSISWNLPPDSHIMYELVEHIPCSSERLHHYNADWMARAGNLDELIQRLCPLWTERISASKWIGTGTLRLSIDERRFLLLVAAGRVTLIDGSDSAQESPTADLDEVELTQQALIQLCFGFRPVSWIAGRPDQSIPEAVLPLMEIIFPQRPGWISPSNYF